MKALKDIGSKSEGVKRNKFQKIQNSGSIYQISGHLPIVDDHQTNHRRHNPVDWIPFCQPPVNFFTAASS